MKTITISDNAAKAILAAINHAQGAQFSQEYFDGCAEVKAALSTQPKKQHRAEMER